MSSSIICDRITGLATTIDQCNSCISDLDVSFFFQAYYTLIIIGLLFLGMLVVLFNFARGESNIFDVKGWFDWFQVLGALYYFGVLISMVVSYFQAAGHGVSDHAKLRSSDNYLVLCGAPYMNCDSLVYDTASKTHVSSATVATLVVYLVLVLISMHYRSSPPTGWLMRVAVNLAADFGPIAIAPGVAPADMIPMDQTCYSNPMWQHLSPIAIVELSLFVVMFFALLLDARAVRAGARKVAAPFVFLVLFLYGFIFTVWRLAVTPSVGDLYRYALLVAPVIGVSLLNNAFMLLCSGFRLSMWTNATCVEDMEVDESEHVPFGTGDRYVDELSHYTSSLVLLARGDGGSSAVSTIADEAHLRRVLQSIESSRSLVLYFGGREVDQDTFSTIALNTGSVDDWDGLRWMGSGDLISWLDSQSRSAHPSLGAASGTTQLDFDLINAYFAGANHSFFQSGLNAAWRSGRQNSPSANMWDSPRLRYVRIYSKAFLSLLGSFPTVETPPTAAVNPRDPTGNPRSVDEVATSGGTDNNPVVSASGVEVKFVRFLVGYPDLHPALQTYCRDNARIRWNSLIEVAPVDRAKYNELLASPIPGVLVTVPSWAVRKVETAIGFKFVVLPETSFEVLAIESPQRGETHQPVEDQGVSSQSAIILGLLSAIEVGSVGSASDDAAEDPAQAAEPPAAAVAGVDGATPEVPQDEAAAEEAPLDWRTPTNRSGLITDYSAADRSELSKRLHAFFTDVFADDVTTIATLMLRPVSEADLFEKLEEVYIDHGPAVSGHGLVVVSHLNLIYDPWLRAAAA